MRSGSDVALEITLAPKRDCNTYLETPDVVRAWVEIDIEIAWDMQIIVDTVVTRSWQWSLEERYVKIISPTNRAVENTNRGCCFYIIIICYRCLLRATNRYNKLSGIFLFPFSSRFFLLFLFLITRDFRVTLILLRWG